MLTGSLVIEAGVNAFYRSTLCYIVRYNAVVMCLQSETAEARVIKSCVHLAYVKC